MTRGMGRLFAIFGIALALWGTPQPEVSAPPVYRGDPNAEAYLAEDLGAAFRGTMAFGPWPAGPWTVHLHLERETFERSTRAPGPRRAAWYGDTLHLRPWDQLRRKPLGPLLRHELTHRRLMAAGLPRWEEEARCLLAESRNSPPPRWPSPPPAGTRRALDEALGSGTTLRQAWAYRCLRAWLTGAPLPPPPPPAPARQEAWTRSALQAEESLTLRWPPERLSRDLQVNGQPLPFRPGMRKNFPNGASFGPGSPVASLPGRVELKALAKGWELRWTCSRRTWVAAATEGELGREAPAEARRALAGLLSRWIEGRPPHPDGTFCPLTHCAVVRGAPLTSTLALSDSAPLLHLAPGHLFFCGSKGGASLSPLEVWGAGPERVPTALAVPGDRWASWVRELSPREVKALQGAVPPGLRPGQRGIMLGQSGPYAVEALRIETGRRFGWTRWPSNACTAQLRPDGGLHLEGQGWGHNVGLCLASARHQARAGWKAEAILEAAFGPGVCSPRATR